MIATFPLKIQKATLGPQAFEQTDEKRGIGRDLHVPA
jgi:hypothetical protein